MLDAEKLTLDDIEALEERGWDLSDIDLDADTAFDEFCEWNGLIGWGPILRHVMARYRAAAN